MSLPKYAWVGVGVLFAGIACGLITEIMGYSVIGFFITMQLCLLGPVIAYSAIKAEDNKEVSR